MSIIDNPKFGELVLFLNEDSLFRSSFSFYNDLLFKIEKKRICFDQYLLLMMAKGDELIPNFADKKLGPQMYGIYWAMMTDLREQGGKLFGVIQELPVYNDLSKK